MTNNKKFDYYIDNLMNHIYEQKLYKLAYDLEINSSANSDSKKFDNLVSSIIENNIILDFYADDIIKNFINNSDESYFYRKAIAIEKNYLYPILFDSLGNPKNDHNYTTPLITLWKNDMDELYIEEVYSRFNKESFSVFLKNNCNILLDNILSYVENKKNKDSIVINCNSKDKVLASMISMILNESLSFDWAEFLVDMDSLRNEMIAFSGNFEIYSEFDKLEEDTKYCLEHHCKYSNDELYDILTNKKGFVWENGLGLVHF